MKRTLAEEPRLASRSLFPHWRPALVRHSDLDPHGHVTNSVFAAWLDDGRYALLREVLRPLLPPDDLPALASLTVDFSREVGFADAPEIGTAVLRLGARSIVMGQGLFVGSACAATAHSVTVVMDGRTRRARPLTDPERAALCRLAGRPGDGDGDWS
ncbi:acyl-CoA thioesterase (plasmid) [Methylobacterium currus]|uniref:acyl-CoA thioesterase n=1 Tax=Methylobacterium currus TaxID=2051553 RepID=UPI001E63866B|nr:thioesterase family protein [Methylobacterium currus]UHC20039.1 acyl-CoA thioesterase [Methylobacterium currus]